MARMHCCLPVARLERIVISLDQCGDGSLTLEFVQLARSLSLSLSLSLSKKQCCQLGGGVGDFFFLSFFFSPFFMTSLLVLAGCRL